MKKILSKATLVSLVIILNACGSKTSEIPSGSTDRKEVDEIYNGTTDARKESVVSDPKDSSQNHQMEPVNSTTGSTVTGGHQ